MDSRETPDLLGHVTRISADSFLDDVTGQAFYLAEIQMDDGEVARLPEPYKRTVYLRYFKGHSAAQIAHAEQLPAAEPLKQREIPIYCSCWWKLA